MCDSARHFVKNSINIIISVAEPRHRDAAPSSVIKNDVVPARTPIFCYYYYYYAKLKTLLHFLCYSGSRHEYGRAQYSRYGFCSVTLIIDAY
jgi:hypothetical protein